MPIDSSIAMGVKPIQIENPMNALAQMMQIKDAQQNSQLNTMKMDEYQRGVTSQNALRQLMSGFGSDHNANQQKLMQGGYLKEAQDYAKNQADVGKVQADSQSKLIETAHKRLDLMGQAFGFVKDNPSAEAALQATDYLVSNGIMTPEQAAQTKQRIAADPSPQTIRTLATQAFQTALSTKDQLPKLQNFNAGDRQVNQAVNPINGVPTQTGSTPILQSADNRASVGASLANAAATREIANATRYAAKIQTGFANEQGLRKEFEGLPEVKNYKQAYPAFAAIKDAAGRNTTQSDINIVYGLAKLYDPTSVVREGEYATVANSPNIPEKVKGYAQYLAGGGRLSPETKAQIMLEATGRIGTYEAEARKAKLSYEGIAKTLGMDPSRVFAGMGDMVEPSQKPTGKTIVKTGKLNGRVVHQYSDGTTDYAN